jgi:hypothetical protein
MLDLRTERPVIRLSEAAEFLPGILPQHGTLHRWATVGVRGVKLEARLVGGRFYTTPQAVERFLAAIEQTRHGGDHGAV